MINTLFLALSLSNLLLLLSFSTRKHTSMAYRATLSNFLEELEGKQNNPKYLSGWSRVLFPTTLLEIAVYTSKIKNLVMIALHRLLKIEK